MIGIDFFCHNGEFLFREQALANQNNVFGLQLILHPAQIQFCQLRRVRASEIEYQYECIDLSQVLCFKGSVNIDTLAV